MSKQFWCSRDAAGRTKCKSQCTLCKEVEKEANDEAS